MGRDHGHFWSDDWVGMGSREVLDLQQYSDKVVRNAFFLICRNGNIIIGLLTYYKN
mgnify:CR=1 FL=1